MYFTLTLNLHYPEDARTHEDAVRQALDPLFQNAVVVNEGEDNEERGFIEVHKCFHDEVPTQPCEVVLRYEVERGRVL